MIPALDGERGLQLHVRLIIDGDKLSVILRSHYGRCFQQTLGFWDYYCVSVFIYFNQVIVYPWLHRGYSYIM